MQMESDKVTPLAGHGGHAVAARVAGQPATAARLRYGHH
jgi:hypothetical protein